MTTIASSSPEKGTPIGSAEVIRLLNSGGTGERRHRRGEHEGDQLVPVGVVAEEARPLFILADGDKNGADRRMVKPPEHVSGRHGHRGHQTVVRQALLEVQADRTGRVIPPSPSSPPVNSVQRKATTYSIADSASVSSAK